DFAAGIQRDAEWPGQAGVAAGDGSGGSLVEQPGAAAQRRIYKHAIGGSIRHVDFAAGVQRDAFWIRQVGVAPADSGGGSLVEQTGAAAHRRIDKHAARAKTAKSVIRYLDFAAGIQRNACWVPQAGVAPADGGDGRSIAVAPLGVNSDGGGAGVSDVNVPVLVKGHELRFGEAGRRRGQRGDVAVARRGISRHCLGAPVTNEERRGGGGAIGAAWRTMKADNRQRGHAEDRDRADRRLSSVLAHSPLLPE